MIDYDIFLNWAQSRFNDIDFNGPNICLNSIYDPDGDDDKHKLWCRPDGITKKGIRENGVYHCWISHKCGTLVGLVMDVDSCSYERACEILEIGEDYCDDQLKEFFSTKKTIVLEDQIKKKLTLPEGVVPIVSLPSWHSLGQKAIAYLDKRKLLFDKLYLGIKGEYYERIIIPYYDADDNLIYYNGRYIGDKDRAKYKGPEKEIGVGKGDVVFMPKWHASNMLLHITEGEFDAMVLDRCKLASCAVGGSYMTVQQRKILKPYQICFCGDNDKPGAMAISKSGMDLMAEGVKNITFVRPPKGYKDWNELYIEFGLDKVRDYIYKYKKSLNILSIEQIICG